MRLLEVLLIVATLPLALVATARPVSLRGRARFWLIVLFAALTLHFIVERVYWQIAPCYLACILLALATLYASRIRPRSTRIIGAFCFFLLFVSAVCLIVLPKFRLPTPTGPYAVGTQILHLTDPARPDPTFKSGKREIVVQLWYPTHQTSGKRAPYRTLAETTPLSSYDAALLTHSILNASPAQEGRPFPVILFNPAWGGRRMQNTFQMEDLASHGFILVAIDHTHNSDPVSFPDGKWVRAADVPAIDDFKADTVDQKLVEGANEGHQQAADDSLALDELSRMTTNPSSVWHGVIDMKRVGALGHSFGGTAAIQTGFEDPRVLSVMNMDGWVFGDIWQHNLPKPMMLMYEDDYPPSTKEIDTTMRTGTLEEQRDMQLTVRDQANLERNLAANGGYEVFIKGAKHMNFSDRSLYSPLRRLTDSGKINAAHAHNIINQYTLAFFSQTLKGTNEPLLRETPSPFPEVTLKIWPAHTNPAQH